MHTVPVQPRHTPSSVGALMDPVFLRQAVNDMVATTDAEGPEAVSYTHLTLPTIYSV